MNADPTYNRSPMPTTLFPYLLAIHITLAISLFVPSIVLPFTLRTRKAAADSPGRVMRTLLRLQSHGTVVIGLESLIPRSGTELPTWNLIMAGAMMALLPPVAVIIFMQRWFVKGLVESDK